jgi:orotidine-5'-phosphate decarboxylase
MNPTTPHTPSINDRLIVALDLPTIAENLALVQGLLPHGLTHVKVGMSLFYEAGPSIIKHLKTLGLSVFVDLKLHDIPNTVARTVEVLIRNGATLLNVHAQGGFEMMQQAQAKSLAVAEELGNPPASIIAVTLLTSFTAEALKTDLQQTNLSPQQYVEYLAKRTQEVGLAGVVCSAQEAGLIEKACGTDFLKITPGIRLADDTQRQDDQARVLTPVSALRQGATHLVVGRPIYGSKNSIEAFERVLAEMKTAQI